MILVQELEMKGHAGRGLETDRSVLLDRYVSQDMLHAIVDDERNDRPDMHMNALGMLGILDLLPQRHRVEVLLDDPKVLRLTAEDRGTVLVDILVVEHARCDRLMVLLRPCPFDAVSIM